MTVALPIKKQVSLHWIEHTISLDVAQDLFSSHQVDRGSKMLLSSLEPLDMPEQGDAADFGCGYGVLGLAWQVTHPAWSMCYVDRDALAVAFAEHNAATISVEHPIRASFLHDVTPPAPPEHGFDLVLWNVPGKAGEVVLRSLLDIMINGLARDGLAALVVVNPLVDVVRAASVRDDVSIDHVAASREHTVLHLRRLGGEVCHGDAFDCGVFDRTAARFSVEGESWQLMPVVGLPEYDSLGHSTALAGKLLFALAGERAPERWMVYGPGVGHLALLCARLWPESAGVVTGRDALALRATERAIGHNGDEAPVEYRGRWGLEETMEPSIRADVVVAEIPDQIQQGALDALMAGIERDLAPMGVAVLHGGSTEITRIERHLKRRTAWRAGKHVKHRGGAAISASYET